MKKQTELAGFERESVPEIDEAVAAYVEAEEMLKRAKAHRDACKERVDFYLAEFQKQGYVWVDGEARLEVRVNESRALQFKWLERPRGEEGEE